MGFNQEVLFKNIAIAGLQGWHENLFLIFKRQLLISGALKRLTMNSGNEDKKTKK